MSLSQTGHHYEIEVNVLTGRVRLASLKGRLVVAWRHLRGAHPMLPCFRDLPSGAREALNICLVCGASLGLPLAAAAGKYELLSEPGSVPVRMRPVNLSPERRALIRLVVRAKRAANRSFTACVAALAFSFGAWGAPVLGFPAARTPLEVANYAALVLWIFFLLASLRATAALRSETARRARAAMASGPGLTPSPVASVSAQDPDSDVDPGAA
jgi:hypothetical protein